MLVRPTSIAPAARSRATAGASAFAAGPPASTFDPARVTSPPTSKRSLTDTGSPSTGERTMPLFRSRSAWSASARAASAEVLRNAREPSPAGSAMRASACSASSRLVILPAASAAARAATVSMARSFDRLRRGRGVYLEGLQRGQCRRGALLQPRLRRAAPRLPAPPDRALPRALGGARRPPRAGDARPARPDRRHARRRVTGVLRRAARVQPARARSAADPLVPRPARARDAVALRRRVLLGRPDRDRALAAVQ